MFITFEGIDGCGKTTQIARVEEFLVNAGKEVIKLREPGGTPFSETIRQILLDSKEDISPISELLLFNSARANLVESVIKPALAENKYVLCDRFFDSTTAYQGYGRGLDIDYVMQCNKFATSGLQPDMTFFLNIPLEMARMRSHHKIPDRIEKSGDDFFFRVIIGFMTLAKSNPDRFITIDAVSAIEDTTKLIISKITDRWRSAL
jgi:dTMP kinase